MKGGLHSVNKDVSLCEAEVKTKTRPDGSQRLRRPPKVCVRERATNGQWWKKRAVMSGGHSCLYTAQSSEARGSIKPSPPPFTHVCFHRSTHRSIILNLLLPLTVLKLGPAFLIKGSLPGAHARPKWTFQNSFPYGR